MLLAAAAAAVSDVVVVVVIDVRCAYLSSRVYVSLVYTVLKRRDCENVFIFFFCFRLLLLFMDVF